MREHKCREIKFRVWDNIYKKYRHKEHYYLRQDGHIFFGCYQSAEDVSYRCTAEFYTGLKDKNRKEIYENDIVKGIPNLRQDDELHPGRVFWQESTGRFAVTGKKPTYVYGMATTLDGQIHYNWEVIGNIHENPELLDAQP